MTMPAGQSDRLPLSVPGEVIDFPDRRIVAGEKLPVEAHPIYSEPWTPTSSVEAFIEIVQPVGLRWPEARVGGPRQDFDGWRSSELGYCRRKAFYTRMGAPRTDDSPSSKGKFLMGHMIELFAVAALQADPRIDWLGAQGDLTHEGPCRGHPDGLVSVHETGQTILFECKSMNSQAFKYAKEWPKSYQRLQVGSYIKAFEDEQGVEIDFAVILYISKDDWLMRECRVANTDQLERDVMVEIEALNELWEAGQIPRRLPSKTHTYKRASGQYRKGDKRIIRNPKCGYCPFAEFCYSPEGSNPLSEETTD